MDFWGSQSSLGVFIFFGIHGIHGVYYGGSKIGTTISYRPLGKSWCSSVMETGCRWISRRTCGQPSCPSVKQPLPKGWGFGVQWIGVACRVTTQTSMHLRTFESPSFVLGCATHGPKPLRLVAWSSTQTDVHSSLSLHTHGMQR